MVSFSKRLIFSPLIVSSYMIYGAYRSKHGVIKGALLGYNFAVYYIISGKRLDEVEHDNKNC